MKNFFKFLSVITIIGLLYSCSSENSGAENVDYTVYKNQTDDLNADALQLNYSPSNISYALNFYGNFDGNKNPTNTNTITYQANDTDIVVNLVIDPTEKRISSLFTTVNGVKSDVVMKFDYINDTEVKVSFHEYDWVTNTSSNIFLTKVIKVPTGNKNLFYSKDGGSDFAYNISALELGVSLAETVSEIASGWSAIGTLSGAEEALAARASGVAIDGASAIGATLFFLNEANAVPLNRVSNLPPPSNIPLLNPVLLINNPTNNLQQSPCFNTNISFEASMDGFGSILIFGVSGGTSPYTFMVGNQLQSSEVFSNEYPDGSYLLGVKDASGCMSVKVIPLDRGIDNIVGTWKLNSIIDESTQTEVGDDCSYNNLYTFNANNSFLGKNYKLTNGTCELTDEFLGTYTITNPTLDFSNSAFGGSQTAQILFITGTTLRLRFTDGQDSFLNTYTRQ